MKKKISILVIVTIIGSMCVKGQAIWNIAGNTGAERAGPVGINYGQPSHALDIKTTYASDGLRITHPNWLGGACGIKLENMSTGGRNWGFFSLGSGDAAGTGNLAVYDLTSGSPRLLINGLTGKVGIGTISPGSKLHIGISTPGDGLTITNSSYGESGIHLQTTHHGGHNWALASLSNNNPQGEGNFTIYDETVSQDRLFINGSTGNVGIGTITPDGFKLSVNGKTRIGVQGGDINGVHGDAMLSVDGKIICRSLYVTTAPGNWADYVFDKEYTLPNLCEVESFYKTYRHLPEIPSEKEIAEKGIDIAEMNKLLLKKVEELTIYLVDQQKQINDLKDKLK